MGNLSETRAWLKQAQAELAGTSATPSHQAGRQPAKTGRWAPVLIVALVVLMVNVVIFTLALIFSQSSQPDDIVAALDVPQVLEAQPLPAQPPPSVLPTPSSINQQIFQDTPPDAAIVIDSLDAPLWGSTAALNVRGLELTQGIQVFQEPENPACHPDPTHPNSIFCNNSMPMIAGRHTMLRAYLSCNQSCPTTETTVRLRVLKDGQEQATLTRQLAAESLQHVTDMPILEARLNLANSVNFEFIPSPPWLEGQITFELEAMPQNAPEQAPAKESVTGYFAAREPLRIAYLPIEYQGLRPPDPVNADYWLKRLYPVPDVEYYRLPMPDITWEGDVSKGEVLRKLLYTYWFYAQYNSGDAPPDQLFGWLPQELYNGGASDPFWCPNCAGPHSSRVAFGGLRPEQDIGGPRILVHEIAHNLGAQHAWSPTHQEDAGCFKAEGVDIQVDPAWPYAQTPHIQEVGIDLYSDPPVIHSPYIYDMMAYCTQPWISPHTYQKIFNSPFLQPDAGDWLSFPESQAQVDSGENGTLLVSGVVYPDGTVSKPEVIKLDGDAFGSADGFSTGIKLTPPPGDDYCLDVQGEDDALLAQHCFDVGFTDLETGQATNEPSPFFFTLTDVNPGDVSQVSVTKNKVSIIIVTPSNNAPEVGVTFPNGGEILNGQQTITWDAFDADGDSLLFDVLYSPNGGASWLPLAVRLAGRQYTFYTSQVIPSQNALIRVIANDGFNTTLDESDGPFTIEAPPENSISLVGPPQVKPGQTFQVDVVANRVTEPGLFGVQFDLSFDSGLLAVESVAGNPSLDLVVDDAIRNDTGRVTFVASRKGRVDNLTGRITLATLTLTAQSEGQSYLDLHNVGAGARGGVRLPISQVTGLSLYIAK